MSFWTQAVSGECSDLDSCHLLSADPDTPRSTAGSHDSTFSVDNGFFLLRKQAEPSLSSSEGNQSITQNLHSKNELQSFHNMQKTYSFEGIVGVGSEKRGCDNLKIFI